MPHTPLIARPVVFPLYAINPDGTCGCGNPECERTGKHPMVLWGHLEESSPLHDCPGYGLKTGAAPKGSGVIVVDADNAEAIASLVEMNGGPLETLTVRTGRGEQFYYLHPGFRVRSSVGELGPKLDIRGDGGFVVGAGSPHKSGKTYAITRDVPPAPCPPWLLGWDGLRSRARGTAEAYAGDVSGEALEAHKAIYLDYLKKAEGAQQGERDAKLWPIVQKGALDLRLPNETLFELIRDHYDPKVDPPWGDALRERVFHKAGSAKTASTRPPREPRSYLLAKLLERVPKRAPNAAGEAPNVGPSEAPPLVQNDTGNAELFKYHHRDKARYVAAWRSWVIWDGHRWVRDERNEVDLLAKDTARAIEREAFTEPDDDKRKRIYNHAMKTQSRAGRENMVALAKAELAAAPEDFDRDAWTLNCENGTLDLRTGELRPHRREDMLTKLAPVTFDPEAVCPLWDTFLNRVMGGDEDLIGYLRRIAGYALTGNTSEHVVFFSHGEGCNGKSVFHNTLMRLLGNYATKAPRGLLFERKNDQHPTEIADLYGRRLALCSEVKQGQRFDESLVKDLVGDDEVKARRMYQDFWHFRPTHKLFISGNHKPRVSGQDHGIWRRIRLIPWREKIRDEEKDKALEEKLAREASGILTWAMVGCLEWQIDGLSEPDDINLATTEYREESDPLHQFYASFCIFEEGAKVARRVLRSAYEGWCRDIGAEPVGAMRVAQSLKVHGVQDGGTILDKRFSSPQEAWRGVRLKTDEERS